MASNNSKYTEELRERTARHIIESGKSATSVAEEMGIDINTVCRWVRDYRRKNHMPSYEESRNKEKAQVTVKEKRVVNNEIKEKAKRILELEEEVEILKKSLRIFMQQPK